MRGAERPQHVHRPLHVARVGDSADAAGARSQRRENQSAMRVILRARNEHFAAQPRLGAAHERNSCASHRGEHQRRVLSAETERIDVKGGIIVRARRRRTSSKRATGSMVRVPSVGGIAPSCMPAMPAIAHIAPALAMLWPICPLIDVTTAETRRRRRRSRPGFGSIADDGSGRVRVNDAARRTSVTRSCERARASPSFVTRPTDRAR